MGKWVRKYRVYIGDDDNTHAGIKVFININTKNKVRRKLNFNIDQIQQVH